MVSGWTGRGIFMNRGDSGGICERGARDVEKEHLVQRSGSFERVDETLSGP